MKRQSAAPGVWYFYYPRLVCVVGVNDEARGTTNFAPVTWATPLSSDPPLFGICLSLDTYTHHLVQKTGEFSINFLTTEQSGLVDSLGRLSGRDIDKVAKLSLALDPPEALATPMLAVAYVAGECVLNERHHVGDQTLFIGEVQRIHAQGDAFDSDGVLRVDRLKPLLYLGARRYTTAIGPESPPPTAHRQTDTRAIRRRSGSRKDS